MKKMIIKILSITLLIVLVFSMLNITNAVTVDDVKSFGGSTGNITGASAVQTIIGTVLDIVRLIGASVAVVMLMTVATKYMIASSGDRADIKKYAFNYVIGAVILFSATGILTMIKNAIISE